MKTTYNIYTKITYGNFILSFTIKIIYVNLYIYTHAYHDKCLYYKLQIYSYFFW
jgi:hypothetical protein